MNSQTETNLEELAGELLMENEHMLGGLYDYDEDEEYYAHRDGMASTLMDSADSDVSFDAASKAIRSVVESDEFRDESDHCDAFEFPFGTGCDNDVVETSYWRSPYGNVYKSGSCEEHKRTP